VVQVALDWLEEELLTEEEKSDVICEAAQSDCGKKEKPDKGNKGRNRR